MNEWLAGASARLAAAVGQTPGDYALGESEVATLLELARVAAHDSGERTNAPLLAYLVGLAHGRSPSADLDQLARRAGGATP